MSAPVISNSIISHTWTINNALVNEFRFTYIREGQLTFQHPQVTGSVQDSFLAVAAQAVCLRRDSLRLTSLRSA